MARAPRPMRARAYVSPLITADLSKIAVARAVPAYAKGDDGVWRQFAANVPRILDGFLQIEPASTGNRVSNPPLAGAVEGSPGVLPNGWSGMTDANVTRTIRLGTENGLPYIEIQLQSAAAPAGTMFLNFDTTVAEVVAPGERIVVSQFLRMSAGSMANVTALALNYSELTAAGADVVPATPPGSLDLYASGVPTAIGSRSILKKTIVNANTARARPYLRMVANGPINISLRLSAPQPEPRPIGAGPTSPMTAAGRSEVATVQVPSGIYDVLVRGRYESTWYRGQTVAAGVWTIPVVDRMGRPDSIRSVEFFAPSVADLAGTASARRLQPIAYVDARALLDGQPRTCANAPTYHIGGVGYTRSSIGQPWAVQLAEGRDLVRFEARQGDGSDQGAGVDRAELVSPWSSSDLDMVYQPGAEIWQSLAVRFSGQRDDDPLHWVVAHQWHAIDNDGQFSSPWVSINLVGGQLRIVTTGSALAVRPQGTDLNYVSQFADSNYPWEAWMDFVFRMKPSSTGAGELDVWRGGRQIVSARNLMMGYNDTRGIGRHQFGIYRAEGSKGTLVAEYANLRTRTTSLASRITDPLPLPY